MPKVGAYAVDIQPSIATVRGSGLYHVVANQLVTLCGKKVWHLGPWITQWVPSEEARCQLCRHALRRGSGYRRIEQGQAIIHGGAV